MIDEEDIEKETDTHVYILNDDLTPINRIQTA